MSASDAAVNSNFDQHVRRQDGLRPKRSGPQPLEDAAFAVDGDDGHERHHGANRHEDRRQHRQARLQERRGARRLRRARAATHRTADEQEHRHRHQQRADRPQRFAHEDLDLEPGQLQESAHVMAD